MLDKFDFIRTDNTVQRFVHPDGSLFVPFGVNYFCKGTGWAPHLWNGRHVEEFDRDFSRMKELGINVIRVFTSVATIMPDFWTINEQTMDYIREMLEYAGKYDIRVIFSGFSMWDGAPEWYAQLPEEEKDGFSSETYLEQLAFGWENLARVCAPYPSLFGYDLMNEPFMDWNMPQALRKWKRYCISEMRKTSDPERKAFLKKAMTSVPADSYTEDRALLEEYQAFRDQLSYDYVKLCVDSIHKADTNHLISIGSHQCSAPFDGRAPSRYAAFDPHIIGDLIDYVSIHYYPFDDTMDIADDYDRNLRRNLNLMSAHIAYMDIGKPVMCEEFGLYGGGAAPGFSWRKPFKYLPQKASVDWVEGTVKRNMARCAGFLNWGFDDCADQGDPTRYQGLYDDDFKIKELGKAYPRIKKEFEEYVSASPAYVKRTPIVMERGRMICDKDYCRNFSNSVIEGFDLDPFPYFVVKK